MRRLDKETVYSKRTYFFGIIAFICFLIERSLIGIHHITGTPAPRSLHITIAVIFAAVSLIAIYYSMRSLKEPTTFKKIIGLLATGFAILQLSLSVASFF